MLYPAELRALVIEKLMFYPFRQRFSLRQHPQRHPFRIEHMAVTSHTKPRKPDPKSPLFAHQNGQWAKKIKGNLLFFCVWSDPDPEFAEYLDQVDEIQAGRDSRKTGVVE